MHQPTIQEVVRGQENKNGSPLSSAALRLPALRRHARNTRGRWFTRLGSPTFERIEPESNGRISLTFDRRLQ
jgi:hypothetical protein